MSGIGLGGLSGTGKKEQSTGSSILGDLPFLNMLNKIPIVGPLVGEIFGTMAGEVTPAPAVEDPTAIPVSGEDVSDIAQQNAIKRNSYKKTILTGNLVPKSTGKKTTLG